MQKDFHYYCIAVLARAAGFAEKDALTIAYASQYVDDATESEPISIEGANYLDVKFDPVRTQYTGLSSLGWSVQKQVYMPFHFIPPIPFSPPGFTFKFITQPDSDFARLLFHEAVKEKDKLLRLCRMGIALHTLADTWAHKGFSGRLYMENNVEEINGEKENFFMRFIRRIIHRLLQK